MDNRSWWVASAHEDREETQTRKGPWTVEEDMQLIKYINLHGEGRWSFVVKAAGLERTGKSCRLRWVNYLRPDLKRSKITHEEERLIIELHGRLGNRWSRIAQSLPGRTDNDIKNYWRTCITKKLNLQAESGNRGMDTDNRVHFERSSTGFYCLTASSSQRTSVLDSEEPSTRFPMQNTEEIAVQAITNPCLHEDISQQEIPISEGNNEYVLQGEIHHSQISDAGQPAATFQEHLEVSDNQFENCLAYNFSMGSLSTDLLSSEFFADRRISLSSSYDVASPEAASDCQTYSNCYSDVLWDMDEKDDRFIRSQYSGSPDHRITGEHVEKQ